MTIPFLTVKPKSIKLKVRPQFPAAVSGGIGIDVAKTNGNYSIDLAYDEFAPITSIPAGHTYMLLWNGDTNQYMLTPTSLFTYVEAPTDGATYGRRVGAWTQVLPIVGGTLTGALTLNGDPAGPLQAATRQYVDAHTFVDAPLDSHTYGRNNGAWTVVGGGLADAPSDGSFYGRLSGAWANGLPLSGGTLTGTLTLNANPVNPLDAATKQYVDAQTSTGVVPENSKSANYTTILGDAGKFIYHPASDANARTFTIDSNASVAYVLGTVISFVNMSVNALTIAINADTLYLAGTGSTGSRSLAQYGCCTALKTDATAWIISGTGLT